MRKVEEWCVYILMKTYWICDRCGYKCNEDGVEL